MYHILRPPASEISVLSCFSNTTCISHCLEARMETENQTIEQTDSVPRWRQRLAESHLDIDAILSDLPNSPTDETTQAGKIERIQQGVALLTERGQVVELRILGFNGKKRTESGYFDNPTKLAKAAVVYDGKAEGIYFTLN